MNIFRFPPPLAPNKTLEFVPGDMLFLAAGLKAHPGNLPPFEHVAIVLKPQSAASMGGVADIEVFGLPESRQSAARNPRGLRARTARSSWLARPYPRSKIKSGVLGDLVTGWNAAYRVDLPPKKRRYLKNQSRLAMGKYIFRYQGTACIDKKPATSPGGYPEIHTNCVGFVRWCYRLARVELVPDHFVQSYLPPYEPPVTLRDFASPGHLARAAGLPVSPLPYVPVYVPGSGALAAKDAPV